VRLEAGTRTDFDRMTKEKLTGDTVGGRVPRGLELAMFVAAMLWAAAASAVARRAAAGIAGQFGLTYGQNLLQALFLLFLAVVGFQTLDWIAFRGVLRSRVVWLPMRESAAREWGSGFAIGWALCLAAVLPVLVVGDFHSDLNRGAGVALGVLASTLTLLVLALAEEIIFRGYPMQRLTQAIGPGWASVVMSAIFAVALVSFAPPVNLVMALVDGFLFGLLLAIAYLRTHALWVGWGLHFGYRVVMAVLLGLPIVGRTDFGSVFNGTLGGPLWLNGGFYGLDSAVLTVLFLLGAMSLLYRVTRDWAWAYTLPEIVAGGYPVEVAPPAAHVAMERAAPPPPPLVQILPSTPQSFSASMEREGSVPKS
jgi:membrane protease YdiL (CAAX protease family)